MGLKKAISDFIKRNKEKSERNKELNKIKEDAYFEAMKIQSELMGRKQAEIEADLRAKAYKKKLEERYNKKMNQYTPKENNGERIDYFGLNRAFPKEVKII